MNLKQLAVGGAVVGMFLATVGLTFGQGKGDFEIKDIRQQLVDAPTFGGAGADLGSHPGTLWRKWLKIEVQFESKPEWADDVQVKYYVLLNDRGEDKLFVGETTLINVAKGNTHYTAVFMPPNSVKRYGGGPAAVVTARLFYKETHVSTKTEATGKSVPASWWEKFTPIKGCLLPPQETPWAPVANEHFEAIKTNRP